MVIISGRQHLFGRGDHHCRKSWPATALMLQCLHHAFPHPKRRSNLSGRYNIVVFMVRK
jgi:hypothetical protein